MIYISGKELLTRRQLRAIPVPERTDLVENSKWMGVNHGSLADSIIEYLIKVGFKIQNETWYCNPNQTALYGSVEINAKGTDFEMNVGQDANFSLGVRHDNAGKYAISFAIGAVISVCENGMFNGDFVVKNRHYADMNLDDMVANAVEEWMSELYIVERFINRMRTIDVNDSDASHSIVLAAAAEETKCMPWETAVKVYREWENPSYEEFQPRTLWSLYNCFTHAGKSLSPPKQLYMLKGLKPLLEDQYAIF